MLKTCVLTWEGEGTHKRLYCNGVYAGLLYPNRGFKFQPSQHPLPSVEGEYELKYCLDEPSAMRESERMFMGIIEEALNGLKQYKIVGD